MLQIIRIFKIISSFLFNVVYWIFNINDLKKTIKKKRKIQPNNINELVNFINKFKWTKEKFDWQPWIITILHRRYQDDCDGAAKLGKWLLKKISINSDYYLLYGNGNYHMITVSKEKYIVISNNNLIKTSPEKWFMDSQKYTKNKYNKYKKLYF